jgi:hypothetical protein
VKKNICATRLELVAGSCCIRARAIADKEGGRFCIRLRTFIIACCTSSSPARWTQTTHKPGGRSSGRCGVLRHRAESARGARAPRLAGLSTRFRLTKIVDGYFEVPPELVPVVGPVEPGEELVLPEEPPGGQSAIAVFPSLLALPLELGLLLALGLLVALLLEVGAFEADELLGPQSIFIAPEIASLLPELVSAPVPAPVVLLVCAKAATLSVKAKIDAVVRRSRFIDILP